MVMVVVCAAIALTNFTMGFIKGEGPNPQKGRFDRGRWMWYVYLFRPAIPPFVLEI